MKRYILFVVVFYMLAGITLTGCKKNSDNAPPVITLLGDNPVAISLNSVTYLEPGYTAYDNVDGDLTARVVVNSSGVNANLKGTYQIKYSVTDAAGNTGSAARGAVVVNDADFLAGVYNVHDSDAISPYDTTFYNATIAPYTTQNNYLTINNFGGFGASNINGVYASAGPSILFSGTGSLGAGKTFVSATGNITNISSPIKITVEYYFTDGGGTHHRFAYYSK